MASLGATLLASVDKVYSDFKRQPRAPKPVGLRVFDTALATPRALDIHGNGQPVVVDSIAPHSCNVVDVCRCPQTM